jgi:hypothetical protein
MAQKYAVTPCNTVPVRSVTDALRSGSLASSNCDVVLLTGHPFAPGHPTARPEGRPIEAVAAALGMEPPEHFICPITLAVMRQPVMDCHGHTFDAIAIAQWLCHNHRCPINRKPLWPDGLRPNLALLAEIEDWRRHFEALQQDHTGPSTSQRDDMRSKRPLTVFSAPQPRDADQPRARNAREFLPPSSSRPDRLRPWWASFLFCGAHKETCSI